MKHRTLSYKTGTESCRLRIFFAIMFIVLVSTSKSFCATPVQQIDDTIPIWTPLHSIAAPGEHIQRRIVGLIGASGPVTLDIIQGKQESYNDEHPVAVQVCIAGSRRQPCYVFRLGLSIYSTIVKAEPVEIAPGQRALLLSTGRYCHSETFTLMSLLVIGPKGKLINIFPDVEISVLQDEISFWRDDAISPHLMVTTARFEWADGDTSYFSKHMYMISAYEFCPEVGRYNEAIWFRLSKKFPGADPHHTENILLNQVMPGIKSRLLQWTSKCIEKSSR